ncbi:hypothetical protein [Frigidibacter sp.]|uniref:hypothetical protein n=1 Tax=Frigidibacter sp. TaxID=2586418 RepID=UPI0027333AA2|nr:hypothetical protein [Frigidibacter sp.]MDP3341811.1 hypothetical protein [Frigidibacter sp.]
MKICSIMFTIGWAAALAFGWMALAAPQGEPEALLVLHMALSALGAGLGLFAWVRIRRGC